MFKCRGFVGKSSSVGMSVFQLFRISVGILLLWGVADIARAQTPASPDGIVIKGALISIVQSVEIPVEQAGVIVEVNVKAGQELKRGDLVARVKDDSLLLKLSRARLEHDLAKMAAASEVDVKYSQKSFDVAVSDLKRSEKANMRVPNSVPAAKLEKQQLERDRTELKLEQAKRDLSIAVYRTQVTSNEIKLAQSELEKTTIKSPLNGLVVSVEKQVGEWVELSDVVCNVVRTDRLQIEGPLQAQLARQINVGTPVKIRLLPDWIGAKEVEGEIVFISPVANPINSMVQVRAEFDNSTAKVPAGLKADIVVQFP
ncbi:MAG: HlyD family efflux transporter periplasmic adaptor subunit [Mariniblastus sp.]|nr:HlyD family efflux transporter periplasmic adaptor subunit [Mariniblastus sp.]